MPYLFTIICFVFLLVMINRQSERLDDLSKLVKLPQPETVPAEKPEFVPEPVSGPWDDVPLSTSAVSENEMPVSEPEPEFQPISFEKLFLGNLFSKIGAVALIIGIGIFVRLISPYLHVNPAVRIALGYIAGAVVFGVGHYLYKKEDKFKNYAEVLFGTGIGIYFVVTFCAVGLYQLFSVTTALVAANFILVAAFFISTYYRSFASFLVALAGCYLSPCFMGDFYSMNVLFVYVLFVNLISVIYVWHNPQKVLLNLAGLIISLLLVVHLGNSAAETYSVYMPLLFWSLYAFADFVNLHRIEEKDDLLVVYFGIFLNFATLIYLLDFIHLDWHSIGNFALYPLVVYGAFGMLPKPEKLRFYINPFLLALAFCSYCFFTKTNLVIAWSVEAFLIVAVSAKFKQPKLSWWGGAFASLAFGYVFSLRETFAGGVEPLPLFVNVRAVLLLLPAVLNLAAVAILKRRKEGVPQTVVQTLRLYAWSAIYIYFGVELNQYLQTCLQGTTSRALSYGFYQTMLDSALGFMFAAHLGRLFRATGFKPFAVVSGMAYIIALLVLIFAGQNFRPMSLFWPLANIRMLAFAGAVFCTICYRRWSSRSEFTYLAILLGFIWANYELNDTFEKFAWMAHQAVAVSVMWLIYAGTLIFVGIRRQVVSLKNSGIVIVILALGKILLFDLRHIEALYKVIAFLVLGIILLSVSYYYARRNKE